MFAQLNEFKAGVAQWPSNPGVSEYLLGPGDQLTFAQSNDNTQNIPIKYKTTDDQLPPTLFSTEGVIGTDGNILLFGLGNILAANRTLEAVRTEVRNILIRNGLAPNFQLEISGFNSKKAFASGHFVNNGTDNEIIFLNNLPITLKQIALRSNISKSNKNFALIKLTRNAKEYRLTAEQLFDLASPEIIIQDNDQIEIEIIQNKSTKISIAKEGN